MSSGLRNGISKDVDMPIPEIRTRWVEEQAPNLERSTMLPLFLKFHHTGFPATLNLQIAEQWKLVSARILHHRRAKRTAVSP